MGINKKFLEQLEIDRRADEEIKYRGLGIAILYAIKNKASAEIFKKLRKICIQKKEILKLRKLIKFQRKNLNAKEVQEMLEIYKNDVALEEVKNLFKLPKKTLELFEKRLKDQKTAITVS